MDVIVQKRGVARTTKVWGLAFIGYVAVASALSCNSAPTRTHLGVATRHHWHGDQGPVVPHDNFPADCSICHENGSWNKLRDDFQFHHGQETGVLLVGAHAEAKCLRCHNDRGPVAMFSKRGCAGCHEEFVTPGPRRQEPAKGLELKGFIDFIESSCYTPPAAYCWDFLAVFVHESCLLVWGRSTTNFATCRALRAASPPKKPL